MTTGPQQALRSFRRFTNLEILSSKIIPPMKKLLFLLSGLCLYCLAACDNDHEPTKPVRPFHGDTLAQIAWNFPFIVEQHYHSIPGIVPEGTTYRVPVIPRSVEDKTKKEYNDMDLGKEAHLVFRATVHGDTINRRRKELDAIALQLGRLTETSIGTSPVLCGVKSIEAVGIAENGNTYDLSWEIKLRIRDYFGRVKHRSSGIVTLDCEDTQSKTAKYVVPLGRIREYELAEHICHHTLQRQSPQLPTQVAEQVGAARVAEQVGAGKLPTIRL